MEYSLKTSLCVWWLSSPSLQVMRLIPVFSDVFVEIIHSWEEVLFSSFVVVVVLLLFCLFVFAVLVYQAHQFLLNFTETIVDI